LLTTRHPTRWKKGPAVYTYPTKDSETLQPGLNLEDAVPGIGFAEWGPTDQTMSQIGLSAYKNTTCQLAKEAVARADGRRWRPFASGPAGSSDAGDAPSASFASRP
jgi:hypothetical protein